MQKLASKYFVTGLHIGEIQVGKHVREQCEKPVAYHMPEVNHPMRSAAQEPGTEHHVGVIFQNRRYKDGVLFGVILEVGVLNDD